VATGRLTIVSVAFGGPANSRKEGVAPCWRYAIRAVLPAKDWNRKSVLRRKPVAAARQDANQGGEG